MLCSYLVRNQMRCDMSVLFYAAPLAYRASTYIKIRPQTRLMAMLSFCPRRPRYVLPAMLLSCWMLLEGPIQPAERWIVEKMEMALIQRNEPLFTPWSTDMGWSVFAQSH